MTWTCLRPDQLRINEPSGPPLAPHRTEFDVIVRGFVARVRVLQRFRNPTDRALSVHYSFPLSHQGALSELALVHAGRRIEGVVRERAEAQAVYETARSYGQRAALLEEQRPSLFTLQASGIGAGEEFSVEMVLEERLAFDDGRWVFTLPMVYTERYVDPSAAIAAPPRYAAAVAGRDDWTVGLRLDAVLGVPLRAVRCLSHATRQQSDLTRGRVSLELAGEGALPDRDFVLEFFVAMADRPFVGAMTVERPRDAKPTFMCVLTPNVKVHEADVLPREMVFVIDRSGSMGVTGMEAAQRALKACLRSLRHGDSVRLIAFDEKIELLAHGALSWSQGTIDLCDRVLDKLTARGGTDILGALSAALTLPREGSAVRHVVLLTDGAVDNGDAVLRQLLAVLGDARVHTFGVGNAVNRYLIGELARRGRGLSEILLSAADVEEGVLRFQQRIQSALLTDLRLSFPEELVECVMPSPLPDLYAGQSLEIVGRLRTDEAVTMVFQGKSARGPFEERFEIAPAAAEAREVLTRLWVRRRVDLLETARKAHPSLDAAIRVEMIGLAERYRLVTPLTSFVAVEDLSVEERRRAEPTCVELPVDTAPFAPVSVSKPEPLTLVDIMFGLAVDLEITESRSSLEAAAKGLVRRERFLSEWRETLSAFERAADGDPRTASVELAAALPHFELDRLTALLTPLSVEEAALPGLLAVLEQRSVDLYDWSLVAELGDAALVAERVWAARQASSAPMAKVLAQLGCDEISLSAALARGIPVTRERPSLEALATLREVASMMGRIRRELERTTKLRSRLEPLLARDPIPMDEVRALIDARGKLAKLVELGASENMVQRTTAVAEWNVDAILEDALDSETMLEEVVRELEARSIEAKKELATRIADKRRLARTSTQEEANAAEWERRAKLITQAGDQESAAEALQRKHEHEALAATLEARLVEQGKSVDLMRVAVHALDDKTQAARRKRDLVRAGSQRQVAQAVPTKSEREERPSVEAEVEAEAELCEEFSSLTAQNLRDVKGPVDASDELAALKAKLSGSRPPLRPKVNIDVSDSAWDRLAESDRAFLRALSRGQRANGSWDDSVERTALALSCFATGGQTHEGGLFRLQLERALGWLVAHLDSAEGHALELAVWALLAIVDQVDDERLRGVASAARVRLSGMHVARIVARPTLTELRGAWGE
ncbi:MAG: VIT domain-containing protein [Polyangiaceae bacterium]